LEVAPGEVFVIGDATFQAGVEDADPAVGELPQRLVVGLVSCPELVVVAAGARVIG
jgi:hypothetical protein